MVGVQTSLKSCSKVSQNLGEKSLTRLLKNKAFATGISRVWLGRGSNGGRGSGGCCMHESISLLQLGRSGDAKTAHGVQV